MRAGVGEWGEVTVPMAMHAVACAWAGGLGDVHVLRWVTNRAHVNVIRL